MFVMCGSNQIGIVILLALLLVSCVRENLDKCSVSLHFKYDYNVDGVDKILEEVDLLDLFIFLEDGRLYKRLSIQPQTEGTSIVITLEAGTYHLVTWGNVPQSTLKDRSYRYDVERGQLVYQSEELAFQYSMPGLFYGTTEPFTIDGENDVSRVVSLINNTKHVDVVIKNAPFAATNCELFAENCNHDNKNAPYGFLNSTSKIDTVSGDVIYRFNTHRLLASDSTITGFVFYGQRTGETEMKQMVNSHLIDLLLKNPYIDCLDRINHYVVELSFGPFGAIGIKVNGWTVVEMPEDL